MSPIQIQILIFLKHHTAEQSRIGILAEEFNLAKPTVSDAVRSLELKGLVSKTVSAEDSRSYIIQVSNKGMELADEIENFANPLKDIIADFSSADKETFWKIIAGTIFKLHQTGVISSQRMCFSCAYFSSQKGVSRCQLLDKFLADKDIRIDCPEFSKVA